MPSRRSNLSVGVFVDVANLARNGGYGMRYDMLREFACRGEVEPLRLNCYVSYDADRAETDVTYREGQARFFALLRDFGYKVIQKNVKWYTDENGNRFGKANADLDLAVDVLLQSENLDRVMLATGDGDFVQVVRALQNKGCRVEIVAFDNVSSDLRREADLFVSGYLIPNLLPVQTARSLPPWGEPGSRVRGVCYAHTGKGYGFMRFMKTLEGEIWKTDSRQADSPYESVFCHDSQLPPEVSVDDLPSRNMIFEFDLHKPEGRENGMQAQNVQWVNNPRRREGRDTRELRRPGPTSDTPFTSLYTAATPSGSASPLVTPSEVRRISPADSDN